MKRLTINRSYRRLRLRPHVRFGSGAVVRPQPGGCLLCANSGHRMAPHFKETIFVKPGDLQTPDASPYNCMAVEFVEAARPSCPLIGSSAIQFPWPNKRIEGVAWGYWGMFGSENRALKLLYAVAQAERAAVQLAPLQSQSPDQAPKSGPAMPTIISSDLTLDGNLTSDGEIQIEGVIKGNITSASIVIGKTGSIIGDIAANKVIVCGRIRGNMRVREIIFSANCHAEGNLVCQALTVEPGAHFEGDCRHFKSPQ